MSILSAGEKLWHIKHCPLFAALPAQELDAVVAASELIQVGKNAVVPPPPGGEPALFFLKRGHIQLTYTDDAGQEAVVILLGPGDVFGSLDDSPSHFGEHCRAVSDSCLCVISKSRFSKLVQEQPNLAISLAKSSFARINRLQIRLAEMMTRHADERLALALLDLDQQVGRDEPDGSRKLNLAITHADLAKLIGTSREMVTMLLGKFRQRGLVESRKGWLYLRDRHALSALVHRTPPSA